MADIQNINKSIYKYTILTIRLMPFTISLFYFINTVLSLFGYDVPILSVIAGTSFITIFLLYLISFAFKFCFYHRIFIHYLLFNNLIVFYDFIKDTHSLNILLTILFFICGSISLINKIYENNKKIYREFVKINC